MLNSTRDVPPLSPHDRAIAALKGEEGYRRHPYPDTGDTLAIGYGHNLHCRGLSQRQAAWLLADTLQELREALVQRRPDTWARMSAGRQAALLEMAYQLGVDGVLGFVRMWQALERGQWRKAAAEMRDSKWARDDTPGRAERVIARFLKG